LALVPGIVAYALDPADIDVADDAYPWLLGQYLSPGLRGLAFAAPVATIVSSLASMMNSTATIFTMDLYKTSRFRENASEGRLVTTGRIVSFACIAIACLMAPQLAALDQVFQYIQEYTGFVSPGVLAVFMMDDGAFLEKGYAERGARLGGPLDPALGGDEVAFSGRAVHAAHADRVFHLSGADRRGLAAGRQRRRPPEGRQPLGCQPSEDPVYNVAAFGILGITAALYAAFW
jgi:SSS family solute:Na+ symporter